MAGKAELQKELNKKMAKLDELIKSRRQATCSTQVSSDIDVRRETEIEELEEEIQKLKQNLHS